MALSRADGRRQEEWRPIFLNLGAVTQAAGSAYVEVGGTKCIASVFGPREDAKAKEWSAEGRIKCHVSKAAFAMAAGMDLQEERPQGRRREWASEATRKKGEEELPLLSAALHRALLPAVDFASFPKLRVDIFVLILQSAGGDFSVATIAASAALSDAAVPLCDLVASSTVSISKGGLPILDPTQAEEESGEGYMMVAYMPSLAQVTCVESQGVMPPQLAAEALELCISGCSGIDKIVRSTIRDEFGDEEGK